MKKNIKYHKAVAGYCALTLLLFSSALFGIVTPPAGGASSGDIEEIREEVGSLSVQMNEKADKNNPSFTGTMTLNGEQITGGSPTSGISVAQADVRYALNETQRIMHENYLGLEYVGSNWMYTTTVKPAGVFTNGGWVYEDGERYIHPSRLEISSSYYNLNYSMNKELWDDLVFLLDGRLPVVNSGEENAVYVSWDKDKNDGYQDVISQQPVQTNGYYLFDGVDDRILTPIYYTNDTFTLMWRYYVNIATSSYQVVRINRPVGNYYGGAFAYSAAGSRQLNFIVQVSNSGNPQLRVNIVPSVQDGQWYTLSAVVEGYRTTNLTVTTYNNGILQSSGSATNIIFSNNFNMQVGPVDGGIAWVAYIPDKALTSEEQLKIINDLNRGE